MIILEYIQQQIRMTHGSSAEAVGDLTDEQWNWMPPGKANSIAVTLLHAYGIEDSFIQGILLKQPTIWESAGWAAKVGLALVGVVIGGLALARAARRIGLGKGRNGAIVALVAGLIAVVNGGLVLAIANGGPGFGSGVVGGAIALVLGLIAMAE